MIAELYITDGATTINLHATGGSIRVKSWTPSILPFKGGGVWSDNPFSEGKILLSAVEDDVIDNFVFSVTAGNQDLLIKQLRDLRMMLGRAVNYWTSDIPARPIYLKKRANCETEYTYTAVKSWFTPDDPAMFENPFASNRGSASELSLLITHSAWLSVPPGKGECIALTNELDYLEVGTVNMVLNPGFETAGGGGADVFANWTEAAGTGTIVRDVVTFHSGVASCRLTSGAGAQPTVSQTFTVPKGDLLRLSFWYISTPFLGYWQAYDETNAAIITSGSVDRATVWTQAFYDIQIPSTCVSMTIMFRGTPIDTFIWNIDDVMLSFLQYATFGVPATCPTSILFNGGFETTTAADNFTTWVEIPGAGTITRAVAPANVHSGLASAKMLGANIELTNTFVCVPGRDYEFSMWRKSNLPSSFEITDVTNGVVIMTATVSESVNWGWTAAIISVPSTCTSIKVKLISPLSVVEAIWYDDVMFIPINNISPDMVPLLENHAAVISSTTKVQLTHVFLCEVATYSANLLYQAFPYNIFKGGSVQNITYFGCATSFVNNTNMVYGLMMRLGGAEDVQLTGMWSFWSGAAWTNIIVGGGTGRYGINIRNDILRDGDVNYMLIPGVSPVATTINFVLAFWIRFVPATWATVGYIQEVDYHPFYPNKPMITVPAESLSSELSLLTEYRLSPLGPSNDLHILDRFTIAHRSVDRGARFNPVIPYSRNGKETEISLLGIAGDVAYQADYTVPSLESVRFTPVTNVPVYPSIGISAPLATQYIGRYRCLLRVRQNGGAAGDITATLLVNNQAYVYQGQRISGIGIRTFYDFGIVQLPGYTVEYNAVIDGLLLYFVLNRSTGAATMDIYDLVLIPVDEFVAEAITVNSTEVAVFFPLSFQNYFWFPDTMAQIGSLDPKILVKAQAVDEGTNHFITPVNPAQVITPAELAIVAGKDMFLIILPTSFEASYTIQTRVSMFGVSRFYDMRGAL